MTLDDVLLHPKSAIAEIERLKRREQDLLETGNRYLQEARDARAELRAAEWQLRTLRSALKLKH